MEVSLVDTNPVLQKFETNLYVDTTICVCVSVRVKGGKALLFYLHF